MTTVLDITSRYNALKTSADSILTQSVSIYEKPDGVRLLETSRRVLTRVETLAFVFLATGDVRYRDRAWSELNAAANFPDWNPSHFLDVAEMTAAFAIGYDWLYAHWTSSQRTTLLNAIVTKGLNPGLAQYQSAAWWTTSIYNWNAVCNGGLSLGAIAIANDNPTLARDILNYAAASLPKGMEDFAPDGGWDEGPGYWDYLTKYLTFYFAGAEAAFGGTFGIANAPGFSQTGYFPIYISKPNSKTFNYSDGGDGGIGGAQLHYLSWKFGKPDFAVHQRARNQSSARELLWFDARGQAPAAAGLPLDRVFHSAEVHTARSAWGDTNAMFAGIKAGNNKQGHEQMDIGTFVLDALGESWAVELGADSYSLPNYFGSQRFTYYRLRAEGQNTLVLNPSASGGQVQTLVAPIVLNESHSDRSFAIADMTPAYTGQATSVKRGIDLVRNRKQVILQDEVTASTAANLWWFMHTKATISVAADGKSATLTLGTKRLWARIISGPSNAVFTQMNAVPLPTSPNPSGQNPNTGIRKLAINLTGVTNLRLTVLFVPLNEAENPPTTYPRVFPLADWSTERSWIEAENASTQSTFAPLQVKDDTAAYNGKYIEVAAGNNSGSAMPANGFGLYPFAIDEPTTVAIWLRVIAPSGTDDSLWMDILNDSQPSELFSLTNTTTWKWVKWKEVAMPIGSYNLQIGYREDGVKLDRILITADLNFAP